MSRMRVDRFSSDGSTKQLRCSARVHLNRFGSAPWLALLVVATLAGATPLADATTPSITVAQTTEPKTLNPVLAADQPTRDVLSVLSSDLIHINRSTLRTEPALAKSWSVSPDGRHYTIVLRDGLRFSDGAPLTADDVVFSFDVYSDPRINSPQRDVLLVDGTPVAATKLSPTTVRFDLAASYAPGERLFDSFSILPKHKLGAAYAEGRFAQAWSVGALPSEFATAGPFRFKQYVPGQRLVVERNPYYWKRDENGQPLPRLDRLEFAFVADPSAQVLRLLARDVSAGSRVRPEDVPRLEQAPFLRVRDAGPGFEYNFLFFNWNAPGPFGAWARTLKFRQAVAHAIDRDAIVRLVYQGRAAALSSQVTPANLLWRADHLTDYRHDPTRAVQLLEAMGLRRNAEGAFLDAEGHPVEFSMLVSATSQVRRKMATLIQDDLARIGVTARIQTTEFGVMMDAVLKTRKFQAAVWGLASGDTDPNADMNVWTTGGTLHVWNMKGTSNPVQPPADTWEADVDRLMHVQMTGTTFRARKAAYDRVQELVSHNLPMVFLASPHVLAAADANLVNFQPAAIDPILLWNAERWVWQGPRP
jgi:peptide/nickel transport system substrate-binding protein